MADVQIDTARVSFVEEFGEDQAVAIEAAVMAHRIGDGVPDVHENDDKGDRPFQYDFLFAIGRECVTRPSFRDEHGITADIDKMKAWANDPEKGDLAHFRGSPPDYLAMVAGVYNDWINMEGFGDD